MSNLFRRNSVVRRGLCCYRTRCLVGAEYKEVSMFTLTTFELVSLIVGCTMVGGVIGVCIMCIMIGGKDGQEH